MLVAHGSADPRAGATTRALARAVRAARPGLTVRPAFLDHAGPRPQRVLRQAAEAGAPRAVVVPLLLTAAYHGRVDLPGALAQARTEGLAVPVLRSDVLGPVGGRVPPLLLAALRRRLDEAVVKYRGVPRGATAVAVSRGATTVAVPGGTTALAVPGGTTTLAVPAGTRGGAVRTYPGCDAVVLAAAGTRDAAARSTVDDVADRFAAVLGLPCVVAYASASGPTVAEAVTALRHSGARRVAVAGYFLATGKLYDIAVAGAWRAGAVAVAQPLGAAPELVELVLDRVDSAGHPA